MKKLTLQVKAQQTYRNDGHDHIDSVSDNNGILDPMGSHSGFFIDAFRIKENLQCKHSCQ